MNDKKSFEKICEENVRNTFNVNYEDACLSKVKLPEEFMIKINSWIKDPKNILWVSGNAGVGKTFLCTAICKYLVEKGKNFRCFSENGFYSLLRSKISQGVDPEWEIKRLCEVPYFILDDVGSSENMTDWQKDQLFSFIDHRWASGLPTVVTSNLFLKDMKEIFSIRFISRIRDKKNNFMEINWIDKRQEDF